MENMPLSSPPLSPSSSRPSSRRALGYAALVVGLICVVLARGFDSLSERGVASADAKLKASQLQFARALEDADTEQRQKLNEERAKLESGEWKTLRRSADDAKTFGARWGYWFQVIFLIGSVALVVGLLIVGVAGSGAERTIALIMLAIITYSIYVGGRAWTDAARGILGG